MIVLILSVDQGTSSTSVDNRNVYRWLPTESQLPTTLCKSTVPGRWNRMHTRVSIRTCLPFVWKMHFNLPGHTHKRGLQSNQSRQSQKCPLYERTLPHPNFQSTLKLRLCVQTTQKVLRCQVHGKLHQSTKPTDRFCLQIVRSHLLKSATFRPFRFCLWSLNLRSNKKVFWIQNFHWLFHTNPKARLASNKQ